MPYKRAQKDFSAEVLAVQKSGANFVLVGGIISETATMLKEIQKNGMDVVRLAAHPRTWVRCCNWPAAPRKAC